MNSKVCFQFVHMNVNKTVYEKQTNKRKTITHNVPFFFMLGHIFDNRGPLMGSLCVSVSCSVPQAL